MRNVVGSIDFETLKDPEDDFFSNKFFNLVRKGKIDHNEKKTKINSGSYCLGFC